MTVVPLADLRAHLNWPASKGTDDDAELLDVAAGAVDTIEGYLLGRPVRSPVPVVEHHDGGTSALLLRSVPCPCTTCAPYRQISITAVVQDGVTLAATAYVLDQSSGLLLRDVRRELTWQATPITVTYAPGYVTSPPWLVMAVKRMVEHLWTKSQQARHSRSAADQGEQSASPVYLLPYMVQSLLTPHLGGGF